MGRIRMELRLKRFASGILGEIGRLWASAAWRVRTLYYYLHQFKEVNKMMDGIMEVNEEKERPAFLFWILEEPGDTEAMTMPELAYEIEKQNYNLSCLKAVEFGEECIDKPSNWLDLMDQTTGALQQLRLSLEKRMEEALGVQTEELPCQEDQPEEFRDQGLSAWVSGRELENPEDLLACWHISNCFPFGLSSETLQLLEQTLTAQINALEAEEAAYEERDALEFWRFLRDHQAEQLEQIQTMMRNDSIDGEEWISEE